MKPLMQLAASALALAGLLGSAATQATNLAELPLKASVLAKPNVIFAMDESGSMDAEVMIDGHFQGWVYFNYWSATQYPDGKPRTGSAAADWNMFYLFPTGTGAGNKVYGDPAWQYGYAIPPTPEMAWTRSPAYNTIYYSSNKTYVPWAPAYVSGALQNYGNAAPGAAKAHPANGTTTVALNADINNSGFDWRFTFLPGTTIPANATDINCLWAAAPGALPSVVTTGQGLCKATVPYYPATFWNKEACTADGTTCVTNWDGQTLKRYEIKAGNTFPSGRSYADEMQNFANWFQYYRKRRLMLAAGMGEVLENIAGMRLGVVAFNNRVAPTMYDSEATAASLNRFRVAGIFYTAEGDGGTPTHATMKYIRDQFDTNTAVVQYACQRNANFIITDGFANDGAVAPPAYVSATWGGSAPYTTTAASSLADKALAYYTLPLRSSGASALAAGKVPIGDAATENADLNPDLHVNTYALTLGMKGTLWPGAPNPFTSAPTWPAPVSNTATMIDDLWHATINGRGKMYLATTPEETAIKIRDGLNDILSQQGAQGGVAVSAVNLDRSDGKAYLGYYNQRGWTGDLEARDINVATAVISNVVKWSAAGRLATAVWSDRKIFSSSGGSGLEFTAANFGASVNPDTVAYTDAQVVDYIRGKRTGEGDIFRIRSALMGAVVNSEPVLARDEQTVYVASGEGMLHAFDTLTGDEMWAYMPQDKLAAIGQSVQRGWVYSTLLDATPSYGKLSDGSKMLVGGLGAAGRSYYALNVSSPRNLNAAQAAAQFKWIFPTAADAGNRANMGYTVGKPVYARVKLAGVDTDVVLVTSGYDNGQSIGDGKGRLWMLKASDGSVIKSYKTSEGTAGGAEAGLAHVAAFRESDGLVKYAYGGDLLGNLWRFDLTAAAGSDIAADRIAVLKDGSGNLQPVTSVPELVMISGKRVVLVGTGRILDIGDFGSTKTQTFYAIADGALIDSARSSLVLRTYTRGSNPEVTGDALDWATQRGWYMDIPAGEQINTDAVVAYGAVAFVSNKQGSTDCSQQSYMYLVNVTTGKVVTGAADGAASQLLSNNATSSRVVVLRDSTGTLHGTVQLSDRAIKKTVLPLGTVIPPAKNAWREIRR
ncbi:MAG: pyrrolo-quinoline quinone [Rubrivivax sp.]|nr:pyrrolo-quinoline quinone [Rubrivivax sp.]